MIVPRLHWLTVFELQTFLIRAPGRDARVVVQSGADQYIGTLPFARVVAVTDGTS